MKKTYTFDTEIEMKGAELIIDPLADSFIDSDGPITSYNKYRSGLSITYIGLPGSVFKEAESKPMWGLLAFAGQLPPLIELVMSIEDLVGDAPNPQNAIDKIREVQDKLIEFGNIGRGG